MQGPQLWQRGNFWSASLELDFVTTENPFLRSPPSSTPRASLDRNVNSHELCPHRPPDVHWKRLRLHRPRISAPRAAAPTVAMESSSQDPLAFLAKNPVFVGLSDAYSAFQARRAKLGLSNPGTVESIAKGV